MRTCTMNITIVSCARRIRFSVMPRPTVKDIKNTRVKAIFAEIARTGEMYAKSQHTKTVTRHIWQEYLERAEDIRHSPAGKVTYALRSQTIERVFADAKEKHAMRYTPYRGLAAVTAWVKLKFAAMNLKKLALHKWRLFLLFYLHLLQEATSLRCKVASLTV